MAVRAIRLGGDEILRKPSREITAIDAHVRALVRDMEDTLRAAPNGAAIAACQIGVPLRVVVVRRGHGMLCLINPRIVRARGRQECVEGCLSFPGQFAKTMRPKSVLIGAVDARGRRLLLKGEGEMAKCFCHELDHLDGIVFLDRAAATLSV